MLRAYMYSFSTAMALVLAMPAAAHAQTAQEIAIQALGDKHLSVDNDSFIGEIRAEHVDNVKLYIAAGALASAKNNAGINALMATQDNKSPEIFNLLLATLPQDPKEAAAVWNATDPYGDTILLRAVAKGNEAFVDRLLAQGVDITVQNSARATPLIVAVQKKNEALVKKLLAVDQKPTPPLGTVLMEDGKGSSPLTYAISEQLPNLVQLLLAAHADAVKPDVIGVTPLMLAAEGGDESIALLLINAGAKINAMTKNGTTPISIAIQHGHGKLARLLIEKDHADSIAMNYASALTEELNAQTIDTDFFAYLLEHTNKNEVLPTSLLFKALDRENHDVAKLLLDRKPDVKATNEQGETLFYHAIDSGFEDIALQLMQMGADTSQTGVTGISPLARAVRHNMAKVAEVLIEKGASVDQKTPEGYTLAEMCVYSGYPETLEVLLSHNVTIEKEFALLWSIRDGKGKAVPVLLGHGASSAIMNQDGIPAISLAAEAGEVEAVKGFIDHKAVLDYPSKTEHIAALATAARAGHLNIVKLLVEAGAPLEQADGFGMTPLAHAVATNQADVVAYLLSKGANPKALDAQKRSVSDIASVAPSSPERDKIISLLAKATAR